MIRWTAVLQRRVEMLLYYGLAAAYVVIATLYLCIAITHS